MATKKQITGIAADFRKTTAGIQLGRALFNPSVRANLTPAGITSMLKAAGIKIPGGVQVGADTAQIIMAGGAFSKAASTSANIGAYLIPVAAVGTAVVSILGELGLMDKDSPGAQVSTFALLTLMVAAGGGMNILADIAWLMYGIGAAIFPPDERPQKKSELQTLARKDAQAWLDAKINLQYKTAGMIFNAYQENKLTAFQMVGFIAEKSPELFLNYFPEMGVFFPPKMMRECFSREGSARHGGFLGIGRNTSQLKETFCFDYKSINNDRVNIQNVFIQKYIVQPFEVYRQLQTNRTRKSYLRTNGYPENAKTIGVFDHANPVDRLHFSDLALLSMFPPYFNYLHDNFDVKPFLRSLGVTPAELGYSTVTDEMEYGDLGKYDVLGSAPVSFNGVEYFTESQRYKNVQTAERNLELRSATRADERGDIAGLLRIPRAERVVTEMGIMPYLPGRMEGKHAEKDLLGYRNIQNYWSTLSIADMLRRDPYMQAADFTEVNKYVEMPAALDERFREIQALAVGKKMNQLAKQNIADFYGADVNKIQFLPPEEGKPGGVILQTSPYEVRGVVDTTLRKNVATQQTTKGIDCTYCPNGW